MSGMKRRGQQVRTRRAVGWSTGRVRDPACCQGGSDRARNWARAPVNWVSQGQPRGKCSVRRRGFRVMRPANRRGPFPRGASTKPIPRWDAHFGGLEDDRKGSTGPHITFRRHWVAAGSAVWRHVHFTLALV